MNRLSRVIKDDEMCKLLLQFDRLRGICYLDNAGAAMYPRNQMLSINEDMMNNLYMNPHTDKFTADSIDQVRYTILKHFNTDTDNYSVIFTANTTAGLKLVAETFNFDEKPCVSDKKKVPFKVNGTSESKQIANNFNIIEKADDPSEKTGAFVYLFDNHTSVLGMREIALERKADIVCVEHNEFLEQKELNGDCIIENDHEAVNENVLFVYSAQSNFNGFKYPLYCINNVRKGNLNQQSFNKVGKRYKNWFVMLDSASFMSTSKLDLSLHQPDFLCMSFYKLFGFPTGLGAVLIKNSSLEVLNKKTYFGGGTVDVVLSGEDFHVKRKDICERFEDGTLSFLSILSLKHCFDSLYQIIPKAVKDDVMETISHHTFYLAKDLYLQLMHLKHPNGNPAVVLYADSDYKNVYEQGAIVTFNLLRPNGHYVGYAEFQNMANLFNIKLRTGCFCNTGSCQRHLQLSSDEIKAMYKAGHMCGDENDLYLGKPTGCIRVSFGYYNTFKDVDELMAVICKCFVKSAVIKPDRSLIDRVHHNGIENGIDNGEIKEFIEPCIWNGTNGFKSNRTSPDLGSGNLEQIAIFPIKSCGAYKINTIWRIGEKGFEYDREWMIIRDNGACLTQKQCTQMCMIRPIFNFRKRLLILSFPGMPAISVPLDMHSKVLGRQASFCQSKVCNDNIQGYDCGERVGDWISEALGISFLRLIKQCDGKQRTQKTKNIENGDNKLISLSNQAQFLLINKATVRWLAAKIEDESFDKNLAGIVDRFRGNIVVDAGEELVERQWTRVVIGNHEFKVEGPCFRCQMVCIDQSTGGRTAEPLRTISEVFEGKMRFGIYLSYTGPLDRSDDRLLRCQVPVEASSESDVSR